MIDHFGISCADFGKSQQFYDRVLGVLGYSRQMDFGEAIGYGRDGRPNFWLADANAGDASGPNREIHVAFQAADTDAVKAFTTSRCSSAPSRYMRHDFGWNITRATSARSCAIPTATTSRRCSTGLSRRALQRNGCRSARRAVNSCAQMWKIACHG